MEKSEHEQDKKEILKGYKEVFGIYSTLGAIYWNLEVYDAKYRKWLLVYLCLSIVSCYYMVFLFLYSTYMSLKLKDLDGLADSAGFFLIFLGLSFVLIAGITHRKHFDYFYRQVGRGYYNYQGETSYERVVAQFKEAAEKRIFILIKPFMYATISITLLCAVFQPLVHYYIDRKPDYSVTKLVYSPLEVYFSFSPHTPFGTVCAVLTFFLLCLIINPQVWGMDFTYIIILSSFTTQWKLLNDSVIKIPQRAMERFTNKFSSPKHQKDIFMDQRYQECIYECLIENVKHHQVILKTKKVISSFLSYCFLVVILNSSLLLATNGMVLADAKMDILFVKYVLIVVAEFVHVVFFCSVGEELTTESAKLFHSIYSFPWYRCNTKVRKAQKLFMMNTMKPAVEKAAILGIAASLETFNSIISSSYTYINLLRKSA